MKSRREIAEAMLGCALQPGGFAPCPGRDRHSKGNGARDFRVVLEGAPTGYCFHASCLPDVEEFNLKLRRAIWREEKGDYVAPQGHWAHVAPEPKAQAPKRPNIDHALLGEITRGVPEITPPWLRQRSPVDVRDLTPGQFLSHLYRDDERIVIFSDEKSQGDFLWWVGHGSFRLSQDRGVKAVRSELPTGGKKGIWYLVQPVSGKWEIRRDGDKATYTRRSQVNVTAWRYYVLESDELPPEQWLKVLVSLSLPVAAIYTSGKRSIHALVKVEVPNKATWDATRNFIRQIVCPLGADAAALSAVRLSRLPGCKRGEVMQELYYLDPTPDHEIIRLKHELR